MNRKTSDILLKIAFILLIAFVAVPVTSPDGRRNSSEIPSFKEDTLECSICLDTRLFTSGSRNVGFHYELLKLFAHSIGCQVRFTDPAPSHGQWEMLDTGAVHLAVINVSDTVPQRYEQRFITSVPIKGNDVWVVTCDNAELANAVNNWFAYLQSDGIFKELSRRYFRSYKTDWLLEHAGQISAISPYDDIIRKYSANVGIDWRLISAIIFEESRYSMGALSDKSANGLMQIKRSTARKYGVDDIFDPESNVRAGTLHFNSLISQFRREGLDSVTVVKFALAAYNAGEGWLQNKREKAGSLGFDPDNWESVIKANRRENGTTARYIDNILSTYGIYCQIID